MSNPSTARLRAAVRAVNIRALDILAPHALANPPDPAHTPHNPPHPATPIAKFQNDPTAALTPRQRHAARLLIAGQTAKGVAAELGIDRHTVSDWKKLPAFQAELTRLLNDLAASIRR